MEYSWAGSKLIHEKNQKQKISRHFKYITNNKTVTLVSAGELEVFLHTF
jgi:hypothetical protein